MDFYRYIYITFLANHVAKDCLFLHENPPEWASSIAAVCVYALIPALFLFPTEWHGKGFLRIKMD